MADDNVASPGPVPDASARPAAPHSNPSILNRNNAIFFLALILILTITIYIRLPLINDQGFYEPDGFYHFSVIRSALNNNFIVPRVLGISGHPIASVVAEPVGLYWVTLFPYFFLQFFGVSYYTVMRLIPLVFGMLDVIGAYFLSRFISKDKIFGLLTMVFVALSSGDAARTSALIYRGDGFVTIFLIGALVFMGLIINEKNRNRKLAYMFLAGFVLSICNLVWNGGSFAVAIYALAFVLISIYAFVMDKRELLTDMGYVVGSIAIWFLISMAYVPLNLTLGGGLTTPLFIPILAVFVLGWYTSQYLLDNRHKFTVAATTRLARSAVVIILIILGSVAIVLFVPSLVDNIFVSNGFIVTTSFAATIQELTPPTFSFLFASFGITLFMSPMAIIMTLSSIYQGYTVLFWIVMLAGFLPYLFMRVYDSGGWLGGSPRLTLDLKPELMMVISFFAITAYLQMFAIRFNSLVAVPIAIISAYTVYWLALAAIRYVKQDSNIIYQIVVAVSWVLVFVLLLLLIDALYGSSLIGLAAAAVLTCAFAIPTYFVSARWSKRPKTYTLMLAVSLVVIVALLLCIVAYYDIIFGSGIVQADSINPQFLQAASWLRNNTAPGSVVLTLWPDGSVVEGWGNRTSVTDSVGSQNPAKANPFALWILNGTDDPGFLTSSVNGAPDYLLVRNVWLEESSGIYTESGINSSLEPSYGYTTLGQVAEGANGTSRAFQFIGASGLTAYLYLLNSTGMRSYLQVGNGISPFSYVAFYNQSDGQYQILQQTAYNTTNGEMLLVIYSGVPNPHLPVNVTGVILFASGMAQSNMLKFLFFCNSQHCAWNNNKSTLTPVFENSDTKIFKITYYNQSS